MGTFVKRAAATLLSLTLFSALPTSVAKRNNADPYEPYNRFVFNISDKAGRYVLTPVARSYHKVTPKLIRTGVSNLFNSLHSVVSFSSNVLRLDVKRTSEDFVRININTTFGPGGPIDVVGTGGVPNSRNTLGGTLASWGWKNSNYLVVPLLGPSTVRDTAGSIITTVYPAKNAMFRTSAGHWSATGLNAVNNRKRLLSLTDSLEGATLDRYSHTRDLYMWMCARQTGGTLPQTPDDDTDIGEPVDSNKLNSLSPTETADVPQTASAPIVERWIRIRSKGGSNVGQVQQRSPLSKYSEAV